tara:strand:- start:761 stop:919 length:159 start_codon:yes stop_codon:yes gene_type:complete
MINVVDKIKSIYKSMKDLYIIRKELKEEMKWFNSLSEQEKKTLLDAFKILNK